MMQKVPVTQRTGLPPARAAGRDPDYVILPIALTGFGGQVPGGALGPGAPSWIVGASFIAAGLLTLYLDALYLRRPLRTDTGQHPTPPGGAMLETCG
jgi:hypothetical protein